MYQTTRNLSRANSVLLNARLSQVIPILEYMQASIGQSSYIETYLHVHNAFDNYSNLTVGDHVYIGKDCFIDLSERVVIQNNVTIAMRVTILTHFNGGKSVAATYFEQQTKPVLIAQGAYIGACATILPGITIGSGGIVGAGAVVAEDVPPYTLVGGVPARIIRELQL